jgi:hypothetical protein
LSLNYKNNPGRPAKDYGGVQLAGVHPLFSFRIGATIEKFLLSFRTYLDGVFQTPFSGELVSSAKVSRSISTKTTQS